MLNIKPPNYKFCPFCGSKLSVIKIEGKNFKHCKKDSWTYFPHAFLASNAIVIKAGKLLLVQRNRKPYKGKWMFPAGFLDYGEHPKECVIRELKEETGLIAKDAELFDVLQTTDDPRAPGNLTFYYKVKLEGPKEPINGDRDENLDIRWFDLLGKIPPIAWKDHKAIIKRLQKELGEDST